MVAIRSAGQIQAGFTEKVPGADGKRAAQTMRGMYSLSASLAGVLGDNWIGAFDLGDGRYAFVAVHNGGIMPGRDGVYDENTARQELSTSWSDIVGNGSDASKDIQVYAPAHWEFGGEEKSLDDLLPVKGLKKEYKLSPLVFGFTKKQMITLALSVLALIGALWGANLLWERHKDAAAAAERQQNEEKDRRGRLDAEAKARAAMVRPWEGVPSARDVIAGCIKTLDNAPPDIAGWSSTQAECHIDQTGHRNNDVVVVTYQRDGLTTLVDFRNTIQAMGGRGVFTENGEEAKVPMRVLLAMPRTVSEQDLPDASDQLDALYVLQQSVPKDWIKVEPKLQPWVPPTSALPGTEQKPPTWKHYEITITTKLMPDMVFDGFMSNGVWIETVAAAVDKPTASVVWTIKGNLYVR